MGHLASTKGFTIIEMLVALGIMGLLASFAVPKYEGYIDQARVARCIAEIRYLDRDIQAYVIANEKYPATLGDLNLTINNMLDPWGNPYQYVLLAGKTLVKNDDGNGPYYAGGWLLDPVPFDPSAAQGFWSGSWLVSEAYAAPPSSPPGPPAGGGGPPAGGGGPPAGGGGPPAGGGGPPAGGGGPPPGVGGGPPVQARKDRFLVPINSDYDLYSRGKDGLSVAPLTAAQSRDDIVRAANGTFVGLAEKF